LDTVKRQVADEIRGACKRLLIDNNGVPAEYEAHEVTPLQTMIRVKTNAGPRYFLVQVTEKL